jgi:hypothetical protein
MVSDIQRGMRESSETRFDAVPERSAIFACGIENGSELFMTKHATKHFEPKGKSVSPPGKVPRARRLAVGLAMFASDGRLGVPVSAFCSNAYEEFSQANVRRARALGSRNQKSCLVTAA